MVIKSKSVRTKPKKKDTRTRISKSTSGYEHEHKWTDLLFEGLTTLFSSKIKMGVQSMVNKAQDLIYHTLEMRMKQVYAGFLNFVATMLLLAAVILLMVEYMNLSLGWIFLIVGFVLLTIGIFIKQEFKRTRHYKL